MDVSLERIEWKWQTRVYRKVIKILRATKRNEGTVGTADSGGKRKGRDKRRDAERGRSRRSKQDFNIEDT
jgi:hypothetical protein